MYKWMDRVSEVGGLGVVVEKCCCYSQMELKVICICQHTLCSVNQISRTVLLIHLLSRNPTRNEVKEAFGAYVRLGYDTTPNFNTTCRGVVG